MRSFEFTKASTEDEALALLAGHADARFLAGGTTLVDLMKHLVETPARVVDINTLPLTDVSPLPGGGLRVGAMVRNSDLAHHPLVRENFPVLSQALLSGASPQLRNMATTGGNLLQRPRCQYFRDIANRCNKREPGSGCSALDGENRGHAILGASDVCIATHPSDMAVALTMLDAVVNVRGPGPSQARAMPIDNFFHLPALDPTTETSLARGELITSVDVPALPFGRRSLYIKVRDRASYAFALASAAVALDLHGGEIREARIALGGVGTVPWRARDAEAALRGRPASSESFAAAASAALAGAVPRRKNGFKIELAKRTLMRALAKAVALA